jgi:hypothetical protein
MAQEILCPSCGSRATEDDFQCPHCELILNPDGPTDEHAIPLGEDEVEPSVVRALLSPPQRTLSREIPAPPQPGALPDGKVTARFSLPMNEWTMPRVVAGVDLALKPMHPFEAYVLSFIDGKQSIRGISLAAKLAEIEVQVVVKSLVERGAVKVEPPTAPAQAPVQRRVMPLQELTAHAPPAAAEGVLQQAISLERKGQVDGAISVLKRAMSRVPNAAPLYNKLALILISHRRDYKEAEDLLKRALALEPENAVYQQNLYKVVGLAASKRQGGTDQRGAVGGLLARLRGGK